MKKLYIALLSVLPLLSGCSTDGLYQDPSDALTDENVLETKDNVYAILMGAYRYTGHYYYLTIGKIAMDVMGDDIKMTDGTHSYSTYNWLVYAYNYEQYPRTVDGWWSAYAPYLWQTGYQAIDACNKIITNKDNLPSGTEDLLAQAYGLRAYNYLNLYDLFCPAYTFAGEKGQGLFLRLTPGSEDASQNVSRSDLGTSMKQIISDLTYAYENCKGTSNYFFNKNTAALLLARTYLDMGDYANARKYVETLSSFDGSDLMSQSDYQSGFNTANSEWLWGINYTSETSNIYASVPSFYHVATFKDAASTFGTPEYGTKTTYDELKKNGVDYMVGYGTVRASFSFRDLFGKGDCRALFPFYLDKKDGLMISKFSSKGTLGVADYPICRLAEAYLIEAECLLNSDKAKGLAVLNTLQAKRGGNKSTELTVDEVWKERRRELYGEGFALPDIKRLQKPLERTGEDQWSAVKSLPANSPRFMFPIPGAELDYNKKTTAADQNEYWR